MTTIGLLGVAPVALAAPSAARDTWKTTTVAQPSATSVAFGSTIDVDVDLDSASGTAPTRGTVTLLALTPGASAWTPVATQSTPSGDFVGVEPTMNTTYKVVYGGWTGSGTDDTYESSESPEFTVGVTRKITYPREGFVLKGKVTPRYRKKTIAIRVSTSRDSGFTKFRKIRTDRKGRYKVTLPKRDGTWYWRVSVRSDARYLGTSYVWETKVFH
jgi:hypothetical protein